ncbi:tape measure protein [Chryseobacterium sp. JV274]|uniref:tape measure protein n=1 Tax=Chryseobacterium sp. JV274 TaxID=1932669 RepID=UPI000986CCC3|nr:tape measure protein [Chryseobacterium sp. JV274]
MNQGALHFDALLSVNNFDQGISRIKSGIREASGVAVKEAQVMDSAFKNLGTAIGGYLTGQSLFSFTKELINVRGEFQKTEIAFTTMLGSADKARQLMGSMVELAAKTPFSLQDVSAGAKQLLAFQVPANQVVETLTRLGNIASGLGVPLERINLIYGQVKAKNKLMGQELLQFTEAGIPMIAELASKFGKTESEITDMVSAGKIGFKDVQDVLFKMTNEGGMFFELMEKQSASLSGKVANLGDAWDQMLNKIGQSNEGILYGGIEGLTYLVDNYRDIAKILLELIAAYGIYKTAVIATNVISTAYNKTIASEIALLGISEKMKLGRAIVTQRQAEASAVEAAAEVASTRAKYSALQAEVSSLAIKKQSAIQSGINASAKAQEAAVQLSLARMELSSLQATGTAREIEIAQKRVSTAQNTVIATQETAAIARKRALAASTEFNTAKQQLENTAQAIGVAEKTAATAVETAQIAAKNANTIATTRLTVVQGIQTLATQAGARAQAFLNATILANPYATAAVLLAALTYAIYKQATALTALQEIQKEFKEELSQVNIGVNEQVTKLEALISTIKKQTTSYDEAKKLLAQVNSLTNNRIEGLTVEAIRTGKAEAAIKNYTKSLYKQAEAMLKVQEDAKLAEREKELAEDLKTVTNTEKFNAVFNIFDANYYEKGWQGAKEKELAAIRKTRATYRKDVEKALQDGLDLSGSTIEPKAPKVRIGILEGLNEELKAANEAIQKAGSDSEIAKWIKVRDKIQAKIDSYGAKRNKNKSDRQFAEIIPAGSIEDLQKQANLLQKAYDTAVDGKVKLRKLDKFGNDKDKNGNPYLTGEIISAEEAGKRLSEINQKINERQYKNFQERLDETKRQIDVRDKLLKAGYSKETVYNMFPEVKDKSFLQYLNESGSALEKLRGKESAENLVKLQSILSEYTGAETFIENVNKQIDELKSKFSGNELIEKLEKFKKANLDGTTGDEKNAKNIAIDKAQEEERLKQQQQYNQFIKDHETFEHRKTEITRQYDDIRKKIQESNVSDLEKARLTDETNKAQAKDISSMSIELFQKTDLWVKAFGDLGRIGPKTLRRMRDEFKKFLNSDAAKALKPEDLKVVQDAYIKLDETVGSRNPFAAISISIKKYAEEKKKLADAEKKYGKGSKEYNEQLDHTNVALGEIFTTSQGAANATIDFAGQMGGALGLMSQEAQQTLKDVQQLFDGIVNAVTGYISGDYGKMAGGIIQMATSLTKLMNGDADRNRSIQQWGIEIDKLKSLYEQLNKTIEKTAGESQLKMQRDLISNLKQQQELLIRMRRTENEKKNSDTDKIASYSEQIEDINNKISDLADEFKNKITTIEFKDLAQKMADALVDAFGQGEDAANSFDKVVDDVMRNAVQNALKMKFLDEAAQNMVSELYRAMGFGNGDTSDLQKQLKNSQDRLKYLNDLINNGNPLSADAIKARFEKEELEKVIASLQQQIASSNIAGNFDGLTAEERDKIKSMGETAMKQYMDALKQYQDLFGQSAENAQGLKGDIKGITEKTAGALEGQINAMRINVAEGVKIHRANQTIFNNQLQVQSQIEQNTRPIKEMYKEIKELNSKIKPGMAGIP